MFVSRKILFLTTAFVAALGFSLPSYAQSGSEGWSGFYLGAHVGYGFGKAFDSLPCQYSPVGKVGSVSAIVGTPTECSEQTEIIAFTAQHNEGDAPWRTTDPLNNINGGLAGIQMGYLYEMNRFVMGGEITGSFSNLTDQSTTLVHFFGPPQNNAIVLDDFDVTYTNRVNMNWFSTAVARVGYVVMPDLLLSANLGMALGQLKFSSSAGYSDETTQTGWTVGTQLDYKLSQSLGLFFGYSFIQFNNVEFRGSSLGGEMLLDNRHEYDFDFHVVKVGVNYFFQ